MKRFFKNIADLVDPKDSKGRTYREVNREKKHNIPIGSLVELDNGVRLFVLRHSRDCDDTPLYVLGINSLEGITCGYSEESLKVIKE